jgi:hypothetical protein
MFALDTAVNPLTQKVINQKIAKTVLTSEYSVVLAQIKKIPKIDDGEIPRKWRRTRC